MKKSLRYGALLVMLLLPLQVACIHTINAPYRVSERRKEVLLYRKDDLSHLIIRTEIAGAKGAQGLAWVIPLPERPVISEEKSGKVFEAMYRLLPDKEQSAPFAVRLLPSCATTAPAGRIKVHPPVVTSNFVLQAVEIKKEGASEELNTWLVGHGFSAVPAENQTFYLHPGRVFMCVRLSHVPDADVFEMPAIHFAWPGAPCQFPLKFSSHSGTFDVDLYVLSENELSSKIFRAWRLNDVGRTTVPLDSFNTSAPWLNGAGRHLTRFHGTAFNSDGFSVRDLPSDPELPSGKF